MVAALLPLLWSTGLHPNAARAAACDRATTPLYDSANIAWDPAEDGGISNAGYDPEQDGVHGTNDRPDTYDLGSLGSLQAGLSAYMPYTNPNTSGCSSDLAGRQIVYPTDATTVNGIFFVRKVYVPATGTPFARALDELTNVATNPRTVGYEWGDPENLGSDKSPAPTGTVVLASSSGDHTLDDTDHWEATAEQDTAATGDARTCDPGGGTAVRCDPPVADIWDESAPDASPAKLADTVEPTALDDDTVAATYLSITLAPGQTAVFMHVMAPRLTTADAVAAGNALGAGPVEVFAGMTDAECAALQNWVCRKPAVTETPQQPQTPAAPSITPPVAFGGIALGSQTLKVKNGKVVVTVPCPADALGNCVGTDTLTTAGKVVVAAAKRKKKVLKLGKGKFSIAPGKKGKVTIKLTKAARRLLARKRTLKAKQKIVAHDSRNVNKTSVGTLKLKSATKKKR